VEMPYQDYHSVLVKDSYQNLQLILAYNLSNVSNRVGLFLYLSFDKSSLLTKNKTKNKNKKYFYFSNTRAQKRKGILRIVSEDPTKDSFPIRKNLMRKCLLVGFLLIVQYL
jgi:hypothetical protein